MCFESNFYFKYQQKKKYIYKKDEENQIENKYTKQTYEHWNIRRYFLYVLRVKQIEMYHKMGREMENQTKTKSKTEFNTIFEFIK